VTVQLSAMRSSARPP